MLQSAESPLSSRLRSLVHEVPSIKCAAFIPLPLNHSQPPLFAHGTAFTFPEANAQDPITNGTRLAIHAHLGPVLKHLEACAVLLAGEHGQLDAGAVHVSEQSGSVFSSFQLPLETGSTSTFHIIRTDWNWVYGVTKCRRQFGWIGRTPTAVLVFVWTSPAQQGAGSVLSGAGAHAVLRLLIEVLTDLCRL